METCNAAVISSSALSSRQIHVNDFAVSILFINKFFRFWELDDAGKNWSWENNSYWNNWFTVDDIGHAVLILTLFLWNQIKLIIIFINYYWQYSKFCFKYNLCFNWSIIILLCTPLHDYYNCVMYRKPVFLCQHNYFFLFSTDCFETFTRHSSQHLTVRKVHWA